MQIHCLFPEIRNRLGRNTAKIAFPLLSLGAFFVVSSQSLAVTRTWVTFGSGAFNNAANWFPAGIPGVNDFVSFEVGSGNPYTVTFPGNQAFDPPVNYATGFLRVRDGGVTFSGSAQAFRGPSTYTVTSTIETEVNRGIIVGVTAGENAVLNLHQESIACCGGLSHFSGVAATLGDAAGSAGTLNVGYGTFDVTGSDFTQTQLIVGNHGAGTLNVINGADVNVPGFNSRTSLGHHAGSSGVVSISGTGSTWTNGNQLWVGENGAGTLTVQNGGSLVTSSAAGFSNILGVFAGGTGTATVTGAGSTWTNSNELRVGNSGNGTLTIADGGSLISNNGAFTSIGGGTDANGTAVVTGAGSTWHTAGAVHVGSTGSGSLGVLNGGSLSTGYARIGGLNSGAGQVLVAGAGSAWTVSNGPLEIGFTEPGFADAPGSVTVSPGATLTVAQDIDLDSTGRLQLQGGTLIAPSIGSRDLLSLQYEGVFEWTAGTLHVGTVHGSATNQAGTLAPGLSAGRTTIDGNYTQQAAAALEIEIGGTTPETEHDVVFLEGTAILDGELQLDLIQAFLPTPHQSFTVLHSFGITGAFSNVANGERLATIDGQGSFLVHYGAGSSFDPTEIVLSDFLTGLLGDFNSDGTYDCRDIDALVGVIAAGTDLPTFDLTGNGQVDIEDLNAWRTIAGAVNNPTGTPFRPGDANLDGGVDGSDFGAWNAHKFASVAAWCSGDFNADGQVDGSDFGIWNANKFTSSDGISAIPEPGTGIPCLLMLLLLTKRASASERLVRECGSRQ